ncbi:MAG: relaxase/mobilization nuclease domain-containing protein [Bacteroidota bacterium]|nr:relaxase/mobilization nuclease domain-containing protein [Bacteroidota bacterium]
MIGKITIGKSFGGCILYCLNDKVQRSDEAENLKNRSEILLFNKCFGNQRELIEQFNEVRQLNRKLSKPVIHVTLSFAPGERLPNNKLMEISEDCAKHFGFENNQFLAVIHKDTKHQHVHLIANRIGFDLKTVSDGNNYKKMSEFCRKTEISYELQEVMSPRRFLSREARLQPRFDQRKNLLKQDIKDSLIQSKSYEEFSHKMRDNGYEILKARGISFIDKEKVKVKGSEVNFSLQTIEKILGGQLTMEKKIDFLNQAMGERLHQKQQLELKEDTGLRSRHDSQSYNQSLLQTLMKAELNNNLPDKDFIKKPKKHRSQHL